MTRMNNIQFSSHYLFQPSKRTRRSIEYTLYSNRTNGPTNGRTNKRTNRMLSDNSAISTLHLLANVTYQQDASIGVDLWKLFLLYRYKGDVTLSSVLTQVKGVRVFAQHFALAGRAAGTHSCIHSTNQTPTHTHTSFNPLDPHGRSQALQNNTKTAQLDEYIMTNNAFIMGPVK